jgi:hypothetical protein
MPINCNVNDKNSQTSTVLKRSWFYTRNQVFKGAQAIKNESKCVFFVKKAIGEQIPATAYNYLIPVGLATVTKICSQRAILMREIIADDLKKGQRVNQTEETRQRKPLSAHVFALPKPLPNAFGKCKFTLYTTPSRTSPCGNDMFTNVRALRPYHIKRRTLEEPFSNRFGKLCPCTN